MYICINKLYKLNKMDKMNETGRERAITELENIIMTIAEIKDHLGDNTERYRFLLSKLDNVTLESEKPSEKLQDGEPGTKTEKTKIETIKVLVYNLQNLNKTNSEILNHLEKII